MTSVQGYHPRTGEPSGEPVPATTDAEVAAAVQAAVTAAPDWAGLPAATRADLLVAAADALDSQSARLAEIADTETALGLPRLTGEIARTSGQLRMFADLVRRGDYLDIVLSPADPASGRPDVRRMQFPLGPVAVFAASNFPFAFSVAGGDTASALAAGCPVVVKAHEAHPHTSLAVAEVLNSVLPKGVLGLVSGRSAGVALVTAPDVRAVGFTGALAGGRALFDLAQQRPDPIPFYGELGSVNPVVVLPSAARERATDIANGYAASLTMGTGQFCTNPGLLFVPRDSALLDAITEAVGGTTGGAMLSERIRDSYAERTSHHPAEPLATGSADGTAWSVTPTVFTVDTARFVADAEQLAEETFGPAGLVVTYVDSADLADALAVLPGSLTASVHADAGDPVEAVGNLLRPKAGRLIHNAWPTGVAVCWAMHHGGPWPSTTAAAHTSVGGTAIRRWLAPVAYQDWPDHALPPELRDANPLGVPRVVQP